MEKTSAIAVVTRRLEDALLGVGKCRASSSEATTPERRTSRHVASNPSNDFTLNAVSAQYRQTHRKWTDTCLQGLQNFAITSQASFFIYILFYLNIFLFYFCLSNYKPLTIEYYSNFTLQYFKIQHIRNLTSFLGQTIKNREHILYYNLFVEKGNFRAPFLKSKSS